MASTLGEMLVIALQGIASGRLEPGTAQEGIAPPFLTYDHDGDVQNYLDGAAAVQQQHLQIEIWSKTYLEANTTADAVETAMAAQRHFASPPSFTSTQLARHYLGRDLQTKLHRVLLEFSAWFVKQ